MVLARNVGATAVLVRTGWGEGSLGAHRGLRADVELDHVARDVLDAVDWILRREGGTSA
jgi:hypothetical protein